MPWYDPLIQIIEDYKNEQEMDPASAPTEAVEEEETAMLKLDKKIHALLEPYHINEDWMVEEWIWSESEQEHYPTGRMIPVTTTRKMRTKGFFTENMEQLKYGGDE